MHNRKPKKKKLKLMHTRNPKISKYTLETQKIEIPTYTHSKTPIQVEKQQLFLHPMIDRTP